MNYYPNYNNQFMGNQIQQPMQQYPQYVPQSMQYKPNMIQGKSVDNIDVVKAMDIPLDGTISYFPLTDGTAIVTKQLKMDGTSQTIIYKPQTEPIREKVKENNFITKEEFEETMKKYDTSELEEEIKALKKKIKELTDKGGK